APRAGGNRRATCARAARALAQGMGRPPCRAPGGRVRAARGGHSSREARQRTRAVGARAIGLPGGEVNVIMGGTAMKRFVILACALALATAASAQLYKYVDEKGKTVYTAQPPPSSDPKQMKIPSTATGGAAAPGKTYVQQDKELQKARDKANEGSKKADETAARAKA